MPDPVHMRRFLDAPLAFWGALALGLVALIAMFVGQAMIGDDGVARAERSAQMEAQAVEAGARQDEAAAVAKARRADLMN